MVYKRKRLLALLLTACMTFGAILETGVCTYAAETEVADDVIVADSEDLDCVEDGEYLDSDEAFDLYAAKALGMMGGISLLSSGYMGEQLSGNNKVLYDILQPQMKKIADGELDKAQFKLPFSTFISGTRLTKEELGVDVIFSGQSITAAASAAVSEKLGVDTGLVVRTLLRDCPYEMYWAAKTTGWTTGRSFSGNDNYLNVANCSMTISFYVDPYFSIGGYEKTYDLDTTKTGAAKHAAENAKTIVETAKSLNDYDKLEYYKDEICALTDYNDKAASNGVSGMGTISPWQLIYVFDQDPTTKVVCEGYSKAFQYLCEMTTFADSDIYVYQGSGDMDGGPHMWNIVHMGDGKNYLVDVTNCDAGTVGYSKKLFMKGYDSVLNGTLDGVSMVLGYRIAVSSTKKINYVYDSNMLLECSVEDRTLAESDYDPLANRTLKPVPETAKGCAGTTLTQEMLSGFPNWQWAESEQNTKVPSTVGQKVSAKAVYVGPNKDNYDNTEVTVIVTAVAHTYGEWSNKIPSTCKTAGKDERTCTVVGCTASETRAAALNPENHEKLVKDEAKAASCVESGLTEGEHCEACGTVTKAQEEVTKTAHVYGEWNNKIPSTCKTAGKDERTCTVVGCTASETRAAALNPENHEKLVKDEAKAASCVESGLTEGEHCEACGIVTKAQEEVTKTAHVYGEWVNKTSSTCKTTGTDERKCIVAGCTASETRAAALNPENHEKLVKDEAKAASCVESGLTEGEHCEACGTVTKAQEEVTKTAHVYGEWVNKTPSTCKTAGVDERKCETEGCTASETRSAALNPENHEKLVKDEAKAASCVESGLTEGEHCEACGTVTKAQEEVTKTAHVYGEWVNKTPSTCLVAGVDERKCVTEGCNATETRAAALDANNHNFALEFVTEKALKTPATCVAPAEYYKSCACGAISMDGAASFVDETNEYRAPHNYNTEGICTICEHQKVTPDGLWCEPIENVKYCGKAWTPQVKVYSADVLLTAGVDYTVSYKNNTNKGTAIVTIKGKGNYTGTETVEFEIEPVAITKLLLPEALYYVVGSTEVKPDVTLVFDGKTLKNGKDYKISVVGDKKLLKQGEYEITVEGLENYDGSVTIPVFLAETKAASKFVVSKIAKQPYRSGNAVVPNVVVKYGRETLTEGTDYEINCIHNTEVGFATMIITGKGDYVGSKYVTYEIVGTPISKVRVEKLETLTYTGADCVQENAEVWFNGTQLEEGKDYRVSYLNHDRAGKATMILTGMGGFTGVLKKSFTIRPYAVTQEDEKIEAFALQTPYAKGGAKAPVSVAFVGKVGKRNLQEGKDYTVTYKDNGKITNADTVKYPTAIVKFKGNFTGTKTVTYSISGQDISKLTLVAADKPYSTKKNSWKQTKVQIADVDGKALKPGIDYEKELIYTLEDGTSLDENSDVPAGTVVVVKAKGMGNYESEQLLEGRYRIVQTMISGAKVVIDSVEYDGTAKQPKLKSIKIGKAIDDLRENVDYRIVGYSNNVNKGTATVTIQGIGNYGGTKVVKFKITARKMKWW